MFNQSLGALGPLLLHKLEMQTHIQAHRRKRQALPASGPLFPNVDSCLRPRRLRQALWEAGHCVFGAKTKKNFPLVSRV